MLGKIPSSKQIHSWLKSKYDIRKTNISGCPFFSPKGFPDYLAVGIGFIEVKRGRELLTNDQIEWIRILQGFTYRFWENYVDVYDKDGYHVDRMEY